MDSVSLRMAPFHPKMALCDVATKRVVFGGPVFIFKDVDIGASGCIMLEVDATAVTVLVSLLPCDGTDSGTGTGGCTAVHVAWCS